MGWKAGPRMLLVFCAESPKSVISLGPSGDGTVAYCCSRFQGRPRKTFPSDVQSSKKEGQIQTFK